VCPRDESVYALEIEGFSNAKPDEEAFGTFIVNRHQLRWLRDLASTLLGQDEGISLETGT
jgi:hypothetical protein